MAQESCGRIGVIVDHPKRDLSGAVMMARALAERGWETALIPLYDQAVDVPLLGLDALVVNFARDVNSAMVRGYRDLGIPVWVLDTEGGVLAERGGNSPPSLARYVRESGYAKLLSGYLFWGSTLKCAFAEDSGMDPERLVVSGCPRFDFASPRWRSLLDYPRRDYILFNANFSLVNPRFSKSAEHEVATLAVNGWDASYVERLCADMRLVLQDFIETIRQVAEHFPDRHILVRPHPFERAAIYSERLADLPNVEVNGEGNVLNVLANAACLVHLNCGTAIEAILLDRLPISLEFINREATRGHSTLPSKVSFPVHSLDQLFETIKGLDGASRAFDFAARHRDHVEPWFGPNDGHAAERVAEAVTGAVQAAGTGKPSLMAALRSSRLSPRLAQIAQASIANLIGTRAWSRLRARVQARRADKLIDLAAVRQIAESLSASGGTVLATEHARHPVSGGRLSSILVRHAPDALCAPAAIARTLSLDGSV